MKKFIEKLIGRLKERENHYRCEVEKVKRFSKIRICRELQMRAYKTSIKIVNELAEGYKNTNIITDFLQYARDNADNYDTNEGWSLADLLDLSIKYSEEYSVNTPQNSADGWIPCSERLPDTEHISGVSETVLVTTDNNSIFTAEYHRDGKWLDDVADWSLEVIAWMPLPTPYKEGVTENE